MTLDQVIAAGPGWTKAYKSSAAGRYQFMRATLKNLKKSLGLTGKELFSADVQDRLGFELLGGGLRQLHGRLRNTIVEDVAGSVVYLPSPNRLGSRH